MLSVAVIAGIAVAVLGIAVGGLMFFAGSMSDAPQAGEDSARSGLQLAGLGIFLGLLIGSLHWWAHSLQVHW